MVKNDVISEIRPESAKTITVMGSFVMDTFALVERFPRDGETVLGHGCENAPGGKGVNQAVAAARQGAQVRMLGAVGDDEDGRIFRSMLEKERIHADGILVREHSATGRSMIMLDGRAENRIVVIPGANHLYGPEDLNAVAETVSGSALVMIQLELRQDVNEQMLRIARDAGVPVVLNPAPVANIDMELLKGVRYFTPNRSEMEFYAGIRIENIADARTAVKKLLSDGIKTIVATLGNEGAIIGDADGIRVIPGYRVEPIDTVGAGDAFNGALAARLIMGEEIDRAVDYANAVGALSVTKRGAIPSIPNRNDVLEFCDA